MRGSLLVLLPRRISPRRATAPAALLSPLPACGCHRTLACSQNDDANYDDDNGGLLGYPWRRLCYLGRRG